VEWHGHCFIQIPLILMLWLRGGERVISRVTLWRLWTRKSLETAATETTWNAGKLIRFCLCRWLFACCRSVGGVCSRSAHPTKTKSERAGRFHVSTCPWAASEKIEQVAISNETSSWSSAVAAAGQSASQSAIIGPISKINFFSFWVSRWMSSVAPPRSLKGSRQKRN
jgi:hypothetical protein